MEISQARLRQASKQSNPKFQRHRLKMIIDRYHGCVNSGYSHNLNYNLFPFRSVHKSIRKMMRNCLKSDVKIVSQTNLE